MTETPRTLWPWALVGLGLLFALFTAWSIHSASVSDTAVSDRGYYARGLDHDRDAADVARGADWQVVVTVSADALGVSVTTADRQPVTAASVRVRLGRAAAWVELDEDAEAPGVYRHGFSAPLTAATGAQLEIRRGDARWERRLLLSP